MKLVARGRGWRWPLVVLELWSESGDLVAELPTALVLEIVLQHLRALALQERIRHEIGGPCDEEDLGGARLVGIPRKPLKAIKGRRLRGYLTGPDESRSGK